MLYQSTVHPGGWFSLAEMTEMAACLRFLLFSFLGYVILSCHLLFITVWHCSFLLLSPSHSPSQTSKDQYHCTARFMRLDCK